MSILPDLKNIKVEIQKIENRLIIENNISLSILRLDKIFPGISGNKFFKLYYFLKEAIAKQKKIITFGGAYSNHLAAAAVACKIYNINCIGIVRGEKPKNLSHTLSFCKGQGMELKFISRKNYKEQTEKDFKIELTDKFGNHVFIPEGGYSKIGVAGAELLSDVYPNKDFTHICCPVGTTTTLAGLINSCSPQQKIVGFSAIKNFSDFETRIKFLIDNPLRVKFFLCNDYHFGGYAKSTNELFFFMNKFYEEFSISTDFVYTGKMMFGVIDLIKNKYFPQGSKIICIHTGGLQGNLSLPSDSLKF